VHAHAAFGVKERDWAAAEGFAEQQGWAEEPVEDSGTGRKFQGLVR
jgi:hypothetical protein